MKSLGWKVGASVAVLGVLLAWQTLATSRGGQSAPAGLVTALLSPWQHALGSAGRWARDVGQVVTARPSIVSENAELKLRLAASQGQNQRLLRYKSENDELRSLLHMPSPPSGRMLAAEIVAFNATDFAQRVTLNVGSHQGVRAKDVVSCAYGLVGRVEQVAPLTCVVLLLTDGESGVGAMTTRTAAKGVVLGTGAHLAQFSYLDYDADVREGDLVVTSGLISGRGAIFPKGMVVGRVVDVHRDATYQRQDATLEPAVPFDRIDAVEVRVGAG